VKPVIGVDLDGVCVDWIGPFLNYVNARLGTCVKYEEITDDTLEKYFGVLPEVMRGIVKEFDEQFSNSIFPFMQDFLEYSKILSQKYQLVVLTSRRDCYKEETAWFVNRYLPQTPVFYCSPAQSPYAGGEGRPTKLEIAHEIDAKYFIEDNLSELRAWKSTLTKPICFAQPWNRTLILTHPQIPRLTWQEIAQLLLA
jgi:5'(3')-deoxyribonucleotidase